MSFLTTEHVEVTVSTSDPNKFTEQTDDTNRENTVSTALQTEDTGPDDILTRRTITPTGNTDPDEVVTLPHQRMLVRRFIRKLVANNDLNWYRTPKRA